MQSCKSITSVWIALVAWGAVVATEAVAVDRTGRPLRRARPPEWSSDVRDIFFDDAPAQLVGQRPDYGRNAVEHQGADLPIDRKQDGASPWATLIDADTIETEIKRLAQSVAGDTASPGKFKGGGYRNCRRDFSLLAVLLAIIDEYDGEVRWSDIAAAMRERCARAADLCQAGTDQSFRAASQLGQELGELVRGSRPAVESSGHAMDWGRFAGRAPLMQRMEIAHQERLLKWLADEREFRAKRDDVRHEAQLLAALAEVIAHEGFEYWDDEQYAQYAEDLRQAANEVASAADTESFEQASRAIGKATTACASCHEGYRG